MAGTRARSLAMVSVAVVAALLATVTSTAPAESTAGEPVVTWPAISGLNPTTTDFPITTAYDGAEYLFLAKRTSGGATFPAQRLESNGVSYVTFPVDFDGILILTPALCPTETYSAGGCETVDSQRSVGVYDEIIASLDNADHRGPSSTISAFIAPGHPGATVSLHWEVVPACVVARLDRSAIEEGGRAVPEFGGAVGHNSSCDPCAT